MDYFGFKLCLNIETAFGPQHKQFGALCFSFFFIFISICFLYGVSHIKNLPVNAGDAWDSSSIPGLGELTRSPGEGNGNPLQYSCLENPIKTEKTGILQSMGSQRVRYNLETRQHFWYDNMVFAWFIISFSKLKFPNHCCMSSSLKKKKITGTLICQKSANKLHALFFFKVGFDLETVGSHFF